MCYIYTWGKSKMSANPQASWGVVHPTRVGTNHFQSFACPWRSRPTYQDHKVHLNNNMKTSCNTTTLSLSNYLIIKKNHTIKYTLHSKLRKIQKMCKSNKLRMPTKNTLVLHKKIIKITFSPITFYNN